MRKSEYLVALGCAVFVFTVTALFLYPGLVPGAWQDFCEEARVRPPENPFPGLWRLLAAELMGVAGISVGLRLLRYLGPVSAGLLSGLLYLSVREALPKPCGVLAWTDLLAKEAVDACREDPKRLKAKKTVFALGIGNDELVCDFANPPLASVELEVEDAGGDLRVRLRVGLAPQGDLPRTLRDEHARVAQAASEVTLPRQPPAQPA